MDKVVRRPFISPNCQTNSFSHQSKCNESEQHLTATSNQRAGWEIMSHQAGLLSVLSAVTCLSLKYIYLTLQFQFPKNATIIHSSMSNFIIIVRTESIFNPHHPAETGPNRSRICRPWTSSHNTADSFRKQVSFIKYLLVFMFSPRSKHKRVNKDKEPGVHYGGQDRQQSSDEPVPKCLQHNWDNCQRRAGHAWQQSTLMI